MQHGLVRNVPWQVSALHHCSDDEISLTLQPILPPVKLMAAAGMPAGLHVSLRLTLGQTLSQTLQTHRLGGPPFELSQALHSYYAVSHAQRVTIEGLQGLTYTDRLRDLTQDVQRTAFALDKSCDRTYAHPLDVPAQLNHRYTLVDAAWQRRIVMDVAGSRSVVVWNPGQESTRTIVDVPDDKWPDFMCIEATNAGPDVIHLQAGESHALSQHLRSEVAC